MKIHTILLGCAMMVLSINMYAQAPCIPNSNQSYPDGWGIYPDTNGNIATGEVGQPYTQIFYFRMPETNGDVNPPGPDPNDCNNTTLNSCNWDIDDVTLNGIYGLSSLGLTYAGNNANHIWAGGEDGCVVVSGTPTAATSPSGNNILLSLTGRIDNIFGEFFGDFNYQGYKIIINPPPCTIAAQVSGTNESISGLFDGQAVVNVTNGQGPYTYLWNTGSTQSQIIGLTAGTYTVTVYDQNCDEEFSIVIEADSTIQNDPCDGFAANVATTSEAYTGSMDGSAEVTTTGGTSPFTFSWSNGLNTSLIDSLTEGPYTVTVTDANNCTATSAGVVALDSIVVDPNDTTINDTTITDTTGNDTTVIANPCDSFSVSIINVQNEGALGTMDGQASVNITDGTEPYTVTWSNGASSALNDNLSAGEYWVYVTDSSSCSGSDTVSLILDDSSAFFCTVELFFAKTNETAVNANDGAASVSATGGDAPYTYEWDNGAIVSSISNLAPGIYVVTATDLNGCEAVDSVKIFEFGDSSCVLNVSMSAIPESFDGSNDGVASALANGGVLPYEFAWSTGEVDPTIYGLGTGNYIVTITDGALCSVTELVTVSVGPISVNELKGLDLLANIYPNPVTDVLNITLNESLKKEVKSIRVYGVTGNLVTEVLTSGNRETYYIDFNNLGVAKGVYTLELRTDSVKYFKKLIVK